MLTRSERIEAVLQLINSGDANGAMTVSKFCKLAKINRSNLYERHPELLEIIKSACTKPVKARASKVKSVSLDSSELNELNLKYKALLRVALEQQAEILWLRKQIPIRSDKVLGRR